MIFAIQGSCQVINTFPWNEGFESGLTNWTQQNVSGSNSWTAVSSVSEISSAQEGTQFACFMHSSTGSTTKLISPVFDLTSLTNPTLFFWYIQKDWGGDQNTLKVYYRTDTSSTGTWTELLYLSSSTPQWTMVNLPLPNASTTYQIAFEGYDDYGYPVGLDDVTLSDLTCPSPTSLLSTNTTSTSFDLSWTDSGTPTSWIVEYKSAGTTTWTQEAASTNPYTISNLNSSSIYDVRVFAICSANDTSMPSPTISASTLCDVISVFPWSEGFENDWAPAVAPGNRPSPNCWTVIDRGDPTDDYYWDNSANAGWTGDGSHSGNNHAICYTDYGGSSHNDWLITPQIALTGNERLRFWAMRADNTSSEPDEISVFISNGIITSLDTTGMGTYDTLSGFTRIFNQNLPVGNWQLYEINLNQYSGNHYIAFVRQGTPDGYYLRLDDVEVSTLPTCMRPTNVTVSNITLTDAEISWMNGSSTDASWWIYYKESSSTTYDSILVNSNPYTLTSLLPSSGYDVYVVTDCSTELSEASSVVNFRTLCGEVSTLPWTDSFDTYGTVDGSFPPCWSRPVINNPYIDYPSIYSYTNHTSPASIMFQTLTTTPTYAITPAFTADINTLMVTFWLQASSTSGSGSFVVGVIDSLTNTSTFEAVQTITPTTTDWTQYVVMLSGVQLQGGGKRIAFKHITNSDWSYYWLDDVLVDVIPACPNVYGLNAEPASTTSVSVNWNDEADQGDGYVIAYASNLNVPFDPATATNIISVPTGSPLPYIIPGFNAGDSVWVAVQRGCGGAWTNTIKVNLPTFANTLPLTANFEDTSLDTVWTITNGTQPNMWYIGVPGANDSDPTDGIDERGLYISSDAGATATYDNSEYSVAFVSTLVEFDNSPSFQLSFDWVSDAESCCDYINVYLLPYGMTLEPGTLPSDQYKINTTTLNSISSFQRYSQALNASYSNTVKQLVLAWKNDGSAGDNPPAKIDNISLVALSCGMPYGLAMDSASFNGTDVYLSWTEPQGSTSWIVEYQQSGTSSWNQVAVSTNPFTLTGLNPGTFYQARVLSICNASDTSAISNVISFQTACVALTVPTLVEGFNTILPSTCWEMKSGLLPTTGTATLTSTNSGWYLHETPIMPGAGNHAYLNVWSTYTNYWLISPSYNLGDGTTPAQIEFDVLLSTYDASGAPTTNGTDDKFAVVVSTDNGLTWDAANAFVWSNDPSATRVYNNLYPVKHIILPLFDPATSLPYTGNVKIAFYGESTVSNADNYIHLDNFEIQSFATCLRPTSLVASAITTTSADVSFQENGTSTTWQYVLTDGTITDPNNGIPVSTTTNPIPLTGLTPQTEYTIWIRSDCTTETSVWSTPLTFVTDALPALAPYSFDFENQTEALAWRNLSGSMYNWAIGQAAGNGPSTQNTADSTAAYISNDNGLTYGASGGIYAYGYRDIDFGATPASYSLNFDWKCQGYVSTYDNSAYSGLIVYLREVTDTLNPTGYPSNVNDNLGLFAEQSTWQTEQLPLDNVSGVKRLIFFYFDSYYNNQPPAAIDNISIVLEPCPRPFDVAVSNTTTTTAEVSWNHPGATSYIVSYRTNATGSTLTDIPATTSPLTISGLTSGTQYLVAVRAICNGDTTIYSETVQFTTPCVDGAISSFPWVEGFEGGLACWQQEYVNGNLSWINNAGYNDDTLAHEGSQIALFKGTARTNVTKLISPLFDISALPTPYLSYWYIIQNWGTTDRDTLRVYSRPSSDSSWTLLSTFYALDSYSWKKDSVLLPSPSSTYQIAFEGLERYGYGVGLDEIRIYDPSGSACAAPTNLAVSGIQNTTATVSWIPAGTESAWQVRLGTTGTPANVTTTSYTIPNLTAGTHYTYYVRANCGTNYSAWVQDTFTTTAGHQAVQVTTVQPTAITQTNATFQGTYVQGSEAVTAIGFEYKTTAATTWTDQAVTTVATPFTYAITTLTANTNYEVRAYAVTATDGRVFGDTLTFATPAIVPPTVTTLAPTAITSTAATFNGTIVQGSEVINARGFEYKLTTQTWQDANIISATGTNNITASVTNLQSGATYEVRAYARTASTTTYGLVISFNNGTNVPPTVTTLGANPIEDRSVTLNGVVVAGDETITNQGFEWKATSASTWTPVTVVPVNDTLIYQLTGLEPETNYEFRTYATTATLTTYGTTKTFLTLGLNEIDGSVISVIMYPNPASQETKLVVTGLQGEVKITISDVQGRIINTINTRAHNNKVEETINVSDMANGVYYVRLQNNQISRTQKLIVK